MKIMQKAGHISLAALLAALTCLSPLSLTAFAEEEEDPAPTETAEAVVEPVEAETDVESVADEAVPEEGATEEASLGDLAADEATSPDILAASLAADEAMDAADSVDAEEEATDSNTFEVSTAEELEAAFATINADGAAGPYTVSLAGDISLLGSVALSSAKMVTFEGNGHRITLEGSASLGVESAGATLTLDGLTIEAGASHTGTMVVVEHGTLNMNAGVTLEGNGIDSAALGGAVSVTNKGTFNMNGGTIQNCVAHTGGGVYVCAATFNMGGNAVIQNCNANFNGTGINGDGGGVFLNVDRRAGATTMTMSGNATIRNGSASSLGGGVFVEKVTTLTMEGNASIVGNTADAGGGVMNYGMATLTAVYNNRANNGADDIFNDGRMKLFPTNPDWVLARTGTHVTGWYKDAYHSWGEGVDEDVAGHRWTPGADYNIEYIPTDGITTEQLTLTAGAPVPVNVIWEDADGTPLFTLAKIEPQDIPAADEYVALSGHGEPTKAADAEDTYEFEGWERTDEPNGDVVYMAEYEATPIPHEAVTDPEQPTGSGAQAEGEPEPQIQQESADGMPQMGDELGLALAVAGGAMAVALAGLALAVRKARA